MKENLLVSSCLLGMNCRYDGGNNYIPEVEKLKEKYHLIPVCAEVYGGLPTPRIPAERIGDKVRNRKGQDVTEAFVKGADEIVRIAEFYQCKKALLKENSPSCGFGTIYDGSFSGKRTKGNGVLAERLEKCGVNILGESRTEELL